MIDFLFLDKGLCYKCKENPIEKYYLCESCLKKLDYIDIEFDLEGNTAYSLYFYNEFMKDLIANYKFSRNTSLYKVFSSMFISYIESKNLIKFDYILASPSSRETLRSRGFDHIGIIVEEINKDLGINCLKDFKKIKNTKSQHTLDRISRMDNLKDAFYLEKEIYGKKVLLVDDLITTGNTCLEIIKELKRKGARKVVCLSLATERSVKE